MQGGSESHSIHCPRKTVVWDCDIGTDHPDVPANFSLWWHGAKPSTPTRGFYFFTVVVSEPSAALSKSLEQWKLTVRLLQYVFRRSRRRPCPIFIFAENHIAEVLCLFGNSSPTGLHFQDSVPAGSYNDPFLSSVISMVTPTWCHGPNWGNLRCGVNAWLTWLPNSHILI